MEIVQGSDEWLEIRKSHITATDASIILRVNPWKKPFQLWQEKLGLIEPKKITERMQRGLDLEETARKLFTIKTGITVKPQVVFHPTINWIMASLDGRSEFGNHIVEIKCAGSKDHATAITGEIPKHYYPQIQHQMMVCKVDEMFYFSFDGFDGEIIIVERDDEYCTRMIEEERKFYDCLINKIPPE